MNCQVPHCPVVAWKHGLCKDHWIANARNEPPGLPTPGLPAWAHPAPLTGAALEPAALRLVWSCVPEHGAQLHEVADACGLGLGATVTALHALETTYGYVTFDGAYWHALIPCGRQRGARP